MARSAASRSGRSGPPRWRPPARLACRVPRVPRALGVGGVLRWLNPFHPPPLTRRLSSALVRSRRADSRCALQRNARAAGAPPFPARTRSHSHTRARAHTRIEHARAHMHAYNTHTRTHARTRLSVSRAHIRVAGAHSRPPPAAADRVAPTASAHPSLAHPPKTSAAAVPAPPAPAAAASSASAAGLGRSGRAAAARPGSSAAGELEFDEPHSVELVRRARTPARAHRQAYSSIHGPRTHRHKWESAKRERG